MNAIITALFLSICMFKEGTGKKYILVQLDNEERNPVHSHEVDSSSDSWSRESWTSEESHENPFRALKRVRRDRFSVPKCVHQDPVDVRNIQFCADRPDGFKGFRCIDHCNHCKGCECKNGMVTATGCTNMGLCPSRKRHNSTVDKAGPLISVRSSEIVSAATPPPTLPNRQTSSPVNANKHHIDIMDTHFCVGRPDGYNKFHCKADCNTCHGCHCMDQVVQADCTKHKCHQGADKSHMIDIRNHQFCISRPDGFRIFHCKNDCNSCQWCKCQDEKVVTKGCTKKTCGDQPVDISLPPIDIHNHKYCSGRPNGFKDFECKDDCNDCEGCHCMNERVMSGGCKKEECSAGSDKHVDVSDPTFCLGRGLGFSQFTCEMGCNSCGSCHCDGKGKIEAACTRMACGVMEHPMKFGSQSEEELDILKLIKGETPIQSVEMEQLPREKLEKMLHVVHQDQLEITSLEAGREDFEASGNELEITDEAGKADFVMLGQDGSGVIPEPQEGKHLKVVVTKQANGDEIKTVEKIKDKKNEDKK